jgi:hypothetical protein
MHIDLFADDDEWLTAVFRDAALEKQPAIRVLEVAEDSKVVLLMPAYHTEGRWWDVMQHVLTLTSRLVVLTRSLGCTCIQLHLVTA